MKKAIAMLLALVMVLSCAACGANETPDPTGEPEQETDATVPQVTVDNPVTYFQMSIYYEDGTYVSLSAYDDGSGKAAVEYLGQIRKVTAMESAVLHAMVAAMESAGLEALDGANVVEDGMDSASMYVAFADESYWGANYTGTIPQEFLDAYAKMEAWFTELLADVPEYVPQPQVMGNVDEVVLAEMLDVLNRSGLEPLDSFYISEVLADDAHGAGLSGAEGISAIVSCGPVMSTTAYSFVIAEVEDESRIDAVRKDFEDHLEWNRWICVSASDAVIAQKGSLVVCVMGAGDLYTQTARAIEDAGWTEVETFENPAL